MIVFFLAATLCIAAITINMMADDEAKKTRKLLDEINKKRA
jgi:hypothetical protein